ncbi:hypothetical protein GCM10010306_004910 [Streptomyces umbrinus]|uniref:hypothetical protein n=1 Tax=Streptomyces umbrinus TaxID=67370 RepID=UPI001677E22B|nr:hypothetical protein [Streptomyces umbrinus]GHB16273.1 hypothetical protein GCM10010306_004910 [Streptomyces umbrinus]
MGYDPHESIALLDLIQTLARIGREVRKFYTLTGTTVFFYVLSVSAAAADCIW